MSFATPRRTRGLRRLAVALSGTALVAGATLTGASAVGTQSPSDPADPLARIADRYTVVRSGLDNPRSLQILPTGNVLVAEAGHGSRTDAGCTERGCAGRTGKVTLLTGVESSKEATVLDRLLSLSGPDGSFATGADGASKRPGGAYVAIIARGPGRQGGKLVAPGPEGGVRVIANISRYEENHDPDGEGVDSNPYAVLARRGGYLVADAGGDSILHVKLDGSIRTWAVMPEYGPRVDAVPTSISRGADGYIYVGELHSEQRGKANVLRYDRHGNLVDKIGGFTGVTGVDMSSNGNLYVSELFGGPCGFDQIPSCFPGRVVKVAPNGDRKFLRVPFPAGVGVRGERVLVSAFSVAPAEGFGGNPDWSGAVWRLRRF
uniref:ScyD/ScyE family protein n=1 Tax=uncultured Nocardioidaceae bacterium TaxID=253824 RepID=A0A6J4KSE9_9ACTN|nr:MAG: hypothetical protein AVDCRST_MAG46-266 [uncultured Nocardioidaceae bacterium]